MNRVAIVRVLVLLVALFSLPADAAAAEVQNNYLCIPAVVY